MQAPNAFLSRLATLLAMQAPNAFLSLVHLLSCREEELPFELLGLQGRILERYRALQMDV